MRSIDRLKAWIERARDAGVVAVDAMAASLDPMQAELCGFSLAVAPNEACYVPLGHRQGGEGAGLFSGDIAPDQIAEGAALDALKPLFTDMGVLKIGHDLKFAWQMFALRGIEIAAYDDTMLMSYALDAGRQNHALASLAERIFTHAAVDIDDADSRRARPRSRSTAVGIDQATDYAAERADIVLRLWQVLKPRLAGRACAHRVRDAGAAAPSRARAYGAARHLDRPGGAVAAVRRIRPGGRGPRSRDQRRSPARRSIRAAPSSSATSCSASSACRAAPRPRPGNGRPARARWKNSPSRATKLPQKILDWRQVSKLKSTYTDALPGFVNPTTHRVHTSYALASTTTGRLSSSEPNLQNIPIRTEDGRKIRRAFIAAPGTKLVSADYSQIELRLLAEIAGIEPLQKAFRDGVDIHAMTASEMFGVPVKGMPADVRRRAKAINFGIVYGISAFGLANQLGIGREEAGAYIKKYFERFPGIRDYIEESKKFAKENGYVVTLFGRKCHYPDIRASNASIRSFNERAAVNARLQGSAADIIRRAMIRMEGALAKHKLAAQMLLQVHDELVFEVPDAEVEKSLPVIKKVMEDAPLPALSLSVPLQVEAHAADNWDAAH